MSKITLNNVADLTSSSTAQTTINTNFNTVQAAFDNTLSRDGTSPNTMGSNLDMNSNQILNLPSPAGVNSPARLIDVTSNPTITVPPVGTSGAVVPLLNANNIWSGTNNLTGEVTIGTTGAGLAKFSVGYSQTPLTANRVQFTIDDDANSANGHVLAEVIGAGGSPYVMAPGALSYWNNNVAVGNNSGAFNQFYSNWYPFTASSGTGGSIIGGFYQAVTNGTWSYSAATGTPGPLGVLSLAETNGGGFAFGMNAVARAKTIAAVQVVGIEVDTDNQINATTDKIGIQVVDVSTSTGTVSGQNVGYLLLNNGGYGYVNGLQFGSASGSNFPLRTAGTLIKSYSASTIANGIDISSLTISTSAFKSTGFNVDGSGNVTVNSLLHPTAVNASVATALSSVGPVGSHTTVQEWFIIKNASGTVRYVPGF